MKDINRKFSLIMIWIFTMFVTLNGIPTGAVVNKKTVKKVAISTKETSGKKATTKKVAADKAAAAKEVAAKKVAADKVAATKKAAADKAAAVAASKAIEGLPSISNLSLSDEAALNGALAAFNSLTAAQQLLISVNGKSALKALVVQLATLKKVAADKAVADQAAAATASKAIKGLPSISNLSLSDEAALNTAIAALNSLTATQQLLISANDKSTLTALVAQLATLKKAAADKAVADQAAVATASKAIEGLPSITNLSLSDETALNSALAAFNSLTATQQLLISANDKSALTALVAQLATLKKSAADQAAAATSSKAIEGLPSISNLSLSDEAALNAALTAFNSLTATQQLLINANDKSTLTALAAQLATLKKAAADKAAADKAAADQAAADTASKAIEGLPSISNLSLSDEAALNAALTAFNSLTATQQLLINANDKSALTALVAQLTILKKAAADNNYKVVYSDEFESLPTTNGWLPISNPQLTTPLFNWLEDKSHSIAHSISIVANQSSANFKKVVSVESGKTYRLSVYIAFNNVTGGKNDGAFAAVAQLDSNGNVIPNTQMGGPIQGSTNWTCMKINNITINDGTTSLGIYLGINGSGTVWFDDLSLEELSN